MLAYGAPVHLTPNEFRLLAALIGHPRQLARTHRGEIDVTRTKGKSTMFTVTLPRATATELDDGG